MDKCIISLYNLNLWTCCWSFKYTKCILPPLQMNKIPSSKRVCQGLILNCICCWGSSSRVLRSVDCPFIDCHYSQVHNQTWRVSTCWDPIYGSNRSIYKLFVLGNVVERNNVDMLLLTWTFILDSLSAYKSSWCTGLCSLFLPPLLCLYNRLVWFCCVL